MREEFQINICGYELTALSDRGWGYWYEMVKQNELKSCAHFVFKVIGLHKYQCEQYENVNSYFPEALILFEALSECVIAL